jgi:hypothetical protein
MMSGNTNNGPMLKATGLWQKTSVKGGQYLTGRLGGVKVLIMENRDRKSDDDPSRNLFFVEAPDRRQGGQQVAQERSGAAGVPQTGQRPSQPQLSGAQGYGKRVPDHHAPLDYDIPDAPEWAR